MVKAAAASCDMPLFSAILETTDSNVPPGWTTIGQTDRPIAIVVAGWLYEMPALLKAARNALPIMSACIGAAMVADRPNTPTVSARNLRAVAGPPACQV